MLRASNSQDLPDGKGKDVVLKMCANCHEIERVTSSRFSRKAWADLVDDMVSRGAEGSDQDVTAVVSYLSRNYGKPVNINAASAKEIENGLGFSTAASELVVRYRNDNGGFKTYDDLLKVSGLDTALLEEQKKNIQF
jgi:competence protein ComEA